MFQLKIIKKIIINKFNNANHTASKRGEKEDDDDEEEEKEVEKEKEEKDEEKEDQEEVKKEKGKAKKEEEVVTEKPTTEKNTFKSCELFVCFFKIIFSSKKKKKQPQANLSVWHQFIERCQWRFLFEQHSTIGKEPQTKQLLCFVHKRQGVGKHFCARI